MRPGPARVRPRHDGSHDVFAMTMSKTQQVSWPDLPLAAWRDTCATLQLFTQIVGKIRLARSPWLNHSWHVALYVTARGLTTSPIPDGARNFEIVFDFIDSSCASRPATAPRGNLGWQANRSRAFMRQCWRRSPNSAFTSPSTTCRTNCRTRSGFRRIARMRPTTATRPGASSRSWSMPIGCSSSSAPGSSARPARCISSGAVSISR